jgi:DNA-binding GntR family transcriptional regulator
MSKALAPIRRESISALVGEELRRGILNSRFEPGAQMGEAQLAEQFGVSRGPVREAMARLVQEGLLVSEPRRGVFVRRLTHADIPDLYLAREAIEATAAVRVAGEQPAQLLGRVERLIERMTAAADKGRWNELAELDLRFHEAIVDAAGSERLSRLFRTLAAETRLCLNALEGSYRRPTDVVDEHRDLLDSIRSGDEPRVRAAFERHLREAVTNLLAAA